MLKLFGLLDDDGDKVQLLTFMSGSQAELLASRSAAHPDLGAEALCAVYIGEDDAGYPPVDQD